MHKTSRYKGVHKIPCGSFRAYFRGKYLGSYSSELEAALAYNREVMAQYGKELGKHLINDIRLDKEEA